MGIQSYAYFLGGAGRSARQCSGSLGRALAPRTDAGRAARATDGLGL